MPVLTLSPDAAIAAAKSKDAAAAVRAHVETALLDRFLAGDATLETFTDEEQKYLPAAIVARLRRAAYLRIVAAMATPAALVAWAEAMTAKHGATVTVFGHQVPWLPALRLVRWGEEPRHWPSAWEDGDLVRAETWLAGKHPKHTVYADGSSPNPGAVIRG